LGGTSFNSKSFRYDFGLAEYFDMPNGPSLPPLDFGIPGAEDAGTLSAASHLSFPDASLGTSAEPQPSTDSSSANQTNDPGSPAGSADPSAAGSPSTVGGSVPTTAFFAAMSGAPADVPPNADGGSLDGVGSGALDMLFASIV
jgi:hypothetical protein